MCGISGIINNKTKTCKATDLLAMTDIITHRGPNGEGYLLFDEQNIAHVLGGKDTPADVYHCDMPYRPSEDINTSTQEFTLAFGHRRLSIIDLSPFGHLPMCYNNGRYWITFNGEIYNYKALKKELQSLGHQFISQTDTEIILAAYMQWGAGCLAKFNGMWAFSIYDSHTQEIFLARDRFGIKPFYYWAPAYGAFCFGSEIKQFTTLPGWKAVLNSQKAFDYLMYSMTDHSDETMFQGVFHIPPGHYFKSSVQDINKDAAGRVNCTKWYVPAYKGYKGTFEEAATSFNTHFKDAVSEHLISDVPVGSALSGGLDSTAIVCEINNLLKEEGKTDIQKTFSYCAADERYNEKKWMDEVVKATKVEAHFIGSNGDSVFKLSNDIVWHNDEPNQSQSELATYEVYKSAKDNKVKVLINGQGADEYLSGYEAFMKFRWVQLLKKLKFKKLNYEINNNQNHLKAPLIDTYIGLFYFLVPGFIRRYLSKKTKSYKTLKSLISMEKLGAKEVNPAEKVPYKNSSIFNLAHKQLLYFPLQKYLRFEDRMSMANSVEARVPFLDYRLVEFTTQLPADYLDGLGETKKILLYGLKDLLPPVIRNRKDKIGFITSEERWVKSDHTKEFRAMLEKSIKNSKGIIKPEALHYFDEMCKGAMPFDYTYWRLISFGIWMEIFLVELP